jgi:hypothetical protein
VGAENRVTLCEKLLLNGYERIFARDTVRLGVWLRGPHGQARQLLGSLRCAYLTVLRGLGWLALLARSDHGKDLAIVGSAGTRGERRRTGSAAAE